MDEYRSPTADDVRNVLYGSDRIIWGNVPDDVKRNLVDEAIQSVNGKFGSWRGFYTFVYCNLTAYINEHLSNTVNMRQISNGC